MNDLSPEARALLRDARPFDEPSRSDADRVHAAVLAKVGVAVGVGAGITAASPSIAAGPIATLGATVVKVGAAIVVAGSLATAGYVTLRSPSPKSHPVAAVHAPPEAVATNVERDLALPPMATTPMIAPREVQAPSRAKGVRVRPSAPAVVEKMPRSAPDLEGEARLLEQADGDLRRGDANAALARLADHAAIYPNGALREEREGMRVVALCRAGRAAEGNAAAERFLARSPRSTLATRIRAACSGD
jgi:hypothetical protein